MTNQNHNPNHTPSQPPDQSHSDSSGSPEPTQMFGRVEGKIDMILRNVEESRADIREAYGRIRELEQKTVGQDDHKTIEQRVRDLERFRNKVLGLGLAISGVFSILTAWIVHKIRGG